jgi:hypothetical protein
MAATDGPDSTMRELPSPPFISVPGLPNFRDAGGYEVTSDSPSTTSAEGRRKIKMVRRGIVFRSSEPSKLTDAGAIQLSHQLGIKLVYDLRSTVEIARSVNTGHGFPLREWEGSERKFIPVFLDIDYSPEALALRYKNYAADSDEVSRVTFLSLSGVRPVSLQVFWLVWIPQCDLIPWRLAGVSSPCREGFSLGTNYSSNGVHRGTRLVVDAWW